jgi:TonB family protein
MSLLLLLGATLLAAASPPRLAEIHLEAAPWNVRSGGIAAYDVRIDEKGSVTSADIVQDVAPYGAMLGHALPSWRFEPAREGGSPVPSRVLVLGLFRPPVLYFAAPEKPHYKSTEAPAEVPWPTAVRVPPYPPNTTGDGKVVLEADVSDDGAVAAVRVVSPATPFDDASLQAARQWTFRPASREGRPTTARVFLIFSFVGITP